jgi:hypothetical protein
MSQTLRQASDDILKGLMLTSMVARKVASDLHTLSFDRIFTQGLNASGSQIGTYTPFTIRKKKEKGRFTSSKVNLRDTDKLANSYLFHCTSNTNCNIGFANISRGDGKTNSELKVKLENQYGDIFGLTAKEEGEIDEIIADFLDNINF